jgi:hypothetical protein
MAEGPGEKNPLKTQTLAEWIDKWERGVMVVLPSGFEIRVRPAQLTDFIMSGEVPDTLTPLLKFLDSVGDDSELGNLETVARLAPLIDAVVAHITIEPKFSANPGKDEHNIKALPADDRVYLWALVTGQADDLRPFRT